MKCSEEIEYTIVEYDAVLPDVLRRYVFSSVYAFHLSPHSPRDGVERLKVVREYNETFASQRCVGVEIAFLRIADDVLGEFICGSGLCVE